MEKLNTEPHHERFLEELRKTDWYKDRPPCIQQAIELRPPVMVYSLNGKGCHIISYEEPESGKLEDVTVTVQKNGIGEEQGLGPEYNAAIHTNAVFGVKLEDLKIFDWAKAAQNEAL
jgi:hypothetical protein